MNLSWQYFKKIIRDGGLDIYYFHDGNKYLLFAKHGYFDFTAEIYHLADIHDFESNFKQSANSYPPSVTNLLGWASSAKQDISNGYLASIDEKLASLGQSYSAAIVSLNAASSATDIFTITGSATKVVRIKRLEVSISVNIALGGTQTVEVQLIKRSTANSGGTSTTPTVVPHDSNNVAGTAVVRAYTANPSVGTPVGTVRAVKVTATSVNTANPIVNTVWEFKEAPIILRGTGEVLAVNLNGNTLTSDDNAINIEWSEV